MIQVCKGFFILALSLPLGALAAGEELPVGANLSTPQQEATTGLVVLSFVEWKALRVHEAQQKVERAQVGGNSGALENKGIDPQKLNFNVEVALQLNIQDYFSMYLKNLSAEELRVATQKLTDAEVYDLLLADRKSVV